MNPKLRVNPKMNPKVKPKTMNMMGQIIKMVDFIAKMWTEKMDKKRNKVDKKFRMTPKRQRMILKVKEMTQGIWQTHR